MGIRNKKRKLSGNWLSEKNFFERVNTYIFKRFSPLKKNLKQMQSHIFFYYYFIYRADGGFLNFVEINKIFEREYFQRVNIRIFCDNFHRYKVIMTQIQPFTFYFLLILNLEAMQTAKYGRKKDVSKIFIFKIIRNLI